MSWAQDTTLGGGRWTWYLDNSGIWLHVNGLNMCKPKGKHMRWSLLGLIWINHPIFIPNDLTHTHIHPNEVGQQDPSGMATASLNPQNWTAAGAFPTQPMIRGAVSALDTLHEFSNPSIVCPVMAFDTGQSGKWKGKKKLRPVLGLKTTSRKSRWLIGINISSRPGCFAEPMRRCCVLVQGDVLIVTGIIHV